MSSQIVELLRSQTDGAADGTGIAVLKDKTELMIGGPIPDFLVKYVLNLQLALFGSYPDHKDILPSAVFTAVFIILMFAHLYIFAKNFSRGHKFWLSLGFAWYCFMRWIGFVLRLVWAKDLLSLKAGMASEVFIILSTIFLASFNLVLLQRIFTWRHPVFGSSKLFWGLMLTLYTVVIAVVVMTIILSLIPYLYLLSEKHYNMCKNVQKVSSILVCLYSVLAIQLTAIAFLFKQTKNLKTGVYQPTWIKSFSPFYYVDKNAAHYAELEALKDNPEEALRSVRIIASSHHFLQGNNIDLTRDTPNNLRLGFSIVLIGITSIFILAGAILRLICTFLDKTYGTQTTIFKPVVMYCMWGLLETIVNVLYLVGRVDLRFYRPDKLNPKNIDYSSSVGQATKQDRDVFDEKEHQSTTDHQSTEPSFENQPVV